MKVQRSSRMAMLIALSASGRLRVMVAIAWGGFVVEDERIGH